MKLELLAPAKNIEIAKAAINAGADAVYMAADKFGARAAALNKADDVKQLIKYAHQYNAKVYLTLNTLLKNDELEPAKALITDMYNSGIDAIIIQDMGLLEMDLPPVPLFASTQTDNRTVAKVKFLESVGFKRVILARELSLEQIKEIRSQTTVDLEFFVHGSLCVSYSGQCYISQALKNRSANRGECAQLCRLSYDLQDKNSNTILNRKHLLSLKDLNLTMHLPDLIDAGITSFKIEGRLKDIDYVKNITAVYRRQLDAVMSEKPLFTKASSGMSVYLFNPDVNRSFNREYTNYFIKERNKDLANVESPKSLGQYIGKVSTVSSNWFVIDTSIKINNNDGLCYYSKDNILQGLKVNTVTGDKISVFRINDLEKGMEIYRNNDHEFDAILQRDDSAVRKISCNMILSDTPEGIALTVTDEDKTTVTVSTSFNKEPARNTEKALQTINENISKTGNTIFEIAQVDNQLSQAWFLPISVINELRRDAIQALELAREKAYKKSESNLQPNNYPYHETSLAFNGNVMNDKAKAFYQRHGVTEIEDAFELREPQKGDSLMTMQHCIKYQYGQCQRFQSLAELNKWNEPLYLVRGNERFKLKFDCAKCEMKVVY